MTSSDSEDELLKRFNALKAPKDDPAEFRGSDPKDQVERAAKEAKDEDDELERIADGRYIPPRQGDRQDKDEDLAFRKRIAGLRGEEVKDDEAELSDGEVEAFMASLGDASAPEGPGHDNGDGLPTPPGDLDALDREASHLLKSTSHLVKRDDPCVPPQSREDRKEEDDGETEEQILARALEAASLDRLPSPSSSPSPPPPRSTTRPSAAAAAPSAQSAFAFPSLPTHDPDAAGEDPEVAARMNLLFGVSSPSTAPSKKGTLPPPPSKRQAGQGWNIAGYEDHRDDDLDSWCCICNSDATVQCLGCDGDLYCGTCWAEGHGPSGEVGHKVRKFVYAKKKAGGGA